MVNFSKVLPVLLGVLAQAAGAAQAESCDWVPSIPGHALVPGWTETHFSYNVFQFDTKDPKTSGLGFKVSGDFPKSRFFAFDVVDNRRFEFAAAFIDKDIVPATGSVNPILQNSPNKVDSFSIELIPENYRSKLTPAEIKQRNIIFVGSESGLSFPQMVYRYWFDDGANFVQDLIPNWKSLPTVTAHKMTGNGQLGEQESCPNTLGVLVNFVKNFVSPEPSDTDETADSSILDSGIHQRKIIDAPPVFRWYQNDGLFKNRASEYLFAGLDLKLGQVGIVKFKLPAVSETGSVPSPQDDMRAFSICILDTRKAFGLATDCFGDKKFKKGHSTEGLLVVGPSAGLTFKSHRDKRRFDKAVKDLPDHAIVSHWGVSGRKRDFGFIGDENHPRFWINQVLPRSTFEGSANAENLGEHLSKVEEIVNGQKVRKLGEYTPAVYQCTLTDFSKFGLNCISQ